MEDLIIAPYRYKYIEPVEMEKMVKERLSNTDFQFIEGYDWRNYLVSYGEYIIFSRLLSKEDVEYRGYYTLNK